MKQAVTLLTGYRPLNPKELTDLIADAAGQLKDVRHDLKLLANREKELLKAIDDAQELFKMRYPTVIGVA